MHALRTDRRQLAKTRQQRVVYISVRNPQKKDVILQLNLNWIRVKPGKILVLFASFPGWVRIFCLGNLTGFGIGYWDQSRVTIPLSLHCFGVPSNAANNLFTLWMSSSSSPARLGLATSGSSVYLSYNQAIFFKIGMTVVQGLSFS